MRNCASCQTDIASRHRTAKRCKPCAQNYTRATSTKSRKLPCPRQCSECCNIITGGNALRCTDCRPTYKKKCNKQWCEDNRDRFNEHQRYSKRKLSGCINPTTETKSCHCESCGDWCEKAHFDHDHISGLFRGWLCPKCNKGIGLFDDSEDKLDKARLYIKRFRERNGI